MAFFIVVSVDRNYKGVMRNILVYSDSLSWGIIPDTRNRLPFAKRWPGVLFDELLKRGTEIRLHEDCLNGRRTAFDDPLKPGRNAAASVAQVIETQSPLDLVITMLGTNDFQLTHDNDAEASGEGLRAVVKGIRCAPIEPGMPMPKVLIVAPPPIIEPKGSIKPKFVGAERKSAGVSNVYKKVAEEEGCIFFDSATITSASKVDGIHLDEEQHVLLGKAVAEFVEGIISA